MGGGESNHEFLTQSGSGGARVGQLVCWLKNMIFVLLNTIFQIVGMDGVDVPQIIHQFTQSQYEIIIDHFSHFEHNPVRYVLKTDNDT